MYNNEICEINEISEISKINEMNKINKSFQAFFANKDKLNMILHGLQFSREFHLGVVMGVMDKNIEIFMIDLMILDTKDLCDVYAAKSCLQLILSLKFAKKAEHN